jgi:hypothetical protein
MEPDRFTGTLKNEGRLLAALSAWSAVHLIGAGT